MIREYCYSCENCTYEFTVWYDWNQIINYKPTCPMCKTHELVYRNYGSEKVIVDDNVPKTLGALADKNSKSRGIEINGQKETRSR